MKRRRIFLVLLFVALVVLVLSSVVVGGFIVGRSRADAMAQRIPGRWIFSSAHFRLFYSSIGTAGPLWDFVYARPDDPAGRAITLPMGISGRPHPDQHDGQS